MEKKYVSTEEVMEYLKISRATLSRYMRVGLPFTKVSYKKNLFNLSEVDEWVKKRTEQFKE